MVGMTYRESVQEDYKTAYIHRHCVTLMQGMGNCFASNQNGEALQQTERNANTALETSISSPGRRATASEEHLTGEGALGAKGKGKGKWRDGKKEKAKRKEGVS